MAAKGFSKVANAQFLVASTTSGSFEMHEKFVSRKNKKRSNEKKRK